MCVLLLFIYVHMYVCTQVRERLRTAQERIVVLEDELMLANQEVIIFMCAVADTTYMPK